MRRVVMNMKINHNTTDVSEQIDQAEETGKPCPECSEMLVEQEGCQTCHNCGYSHC